MKISHQLVAHRGWQHRYPENTLPAITAAIDVGAQHIEIDIQLTADGTPMLCHDHKLDRICASQLNINHTTDRHLAELSAYEPKRLGDKFLGTSLLALSDCVDLLKSQPQITLYVELKRQSIREFGSIAVLDAVLPLIETIRQHCFLISFDSGILGAAKNAGWQHIALVLTSYEQAFSSETTALNPPLIFCDKDLLNNHNRLDKLPYPTAIYEVADYQQAVALISQGAALVETFCIGELISADKSTD